MLKNNKKTDQYFWGFLRPQEHVTPGAWQNPGTTKIPLLPLVGDKKRVYSLVAIAGPKPVRGGGGGGVQGKSATSGILKWWLSFYLWKIY